MKKSICLLSFIFITAILFAEKPGTLYSICESLASNPNTTGDFTQIKTIQTNGRKLKSTGKFIIGTDGILWSTEKPIYSSLVLTKTAVVQTAAKGKKTVLSGKDNEIFKNISETLTSVLSGNVTELKKNFYCEFTMNNNSEWVISLEPKDSTVASVMKKLVLSGSYKDFAVLTSLVMSEASGNTISYEFMNQKYPEELSEDEKQIFIVE